MARLVLVVRANISAESQAKADASRSCCWALPRAGRRNRRVSDPMLISSQQSISTVLEQVATSFTQCAAVLVRGRNMELWRAIVVIEILQGNRLGGGLIPPVREIFGRHGANVPLKGNVRQSGRPWAVRHGLWAS